MELARSASCRAEHICYQGNLIHTYFLCVSQGLHYLIFYLFGEWLGEITHLEISVSDVAELSIGELVHNCNYSRHHHLVQLLGSSHREDESSTNFLYILWLEMLNIILNSLFEETE